MPWWASHVHALQARQCTLPGCQPSHAWPKGLGSRVRAEPYSQCCPRLQVVLEGLDRTPTATEAASPFEPQSLPPVVRFEEVPQLQRFFPHGAPLVQLLVTAFEPREGEAAHLTPLQRDGSASIEVGGCTPVRARAVAALGGSGGGQHTWTTHCPPCW